jgi:uncharacterized UPF0160 family protein
MIYKSLGREFIRSILNIEDKDDMEEIYRSFYLGFIQEIDAIDNGIKQTDSKLEYRTCTNLSTIINRLNHPQIYNKEKQMAHFSKAIDYAQETATIILRSIYQRRIQYNSDLIPLKKPLRKVLN